MVSWIGYRWLAEHFQVAPVQPFWVESAIGKSRRTLQSPETTTEVYAAAMRPADTLSAHLTFALKHEGVHLEFLARLFDRVAEADMAAWINGERTGQYARRAGFLWEWLKGRPLSGVAAVAAGNYVTVLDPAQVLTATAAVNNPRWRIRDNLPGTRDFCPLVRRTPAVQEAEAYDCAAGFSRLEAEYGVDLLLRSASWLTAKESRASFLIEHEENEKDRIKRFAAMMERFCGQFPNPLDRRLLADMQKEVIGGKTTLQHFGLRQSPVFVGDISDFRERVHYVAPHWQRLESLLTGMEAFIKRTGGRAAIPRAAVVAFGFVYVHPLADGNGRIHRFLINDLLRRDGALPRPFILPVSATIADSARNRARYDEALEIFSTPFMARYGECCEFGADFRGHDDGIQSNFGFSAWDDALPAWRYPDLTRHVAYLADVIAETIGQEMGKEARLLRSWDHARSRVKDRVEGPTQDIDRIIRSVRENAGKVSNKLADEFPVLQDAVVAASVAEAVMAAFAP